MWNILDPKTFNKNCFFILLRNPWTPKITIDFVIFTLSSHKLDEPKDSAIDSQLFFFNTLWQASEELEKKRNEHFQW